VLSEAIQELKAAVENSSGVAKLIEALPSANHDQLVDVFICIQAKNWSGIMCVCMRACVCVHMRACMCVCDPNTTPHH